MDEWITKGHNTKAAMFTDDLNFTMKESKSLNLITGVILLVLTVLILYHIFTDYHFDQMVVYKKLLLLSLFPAIFFLRRGFKNTVLLTINKTDIYRCGDLLTTWDNFICANIMQDQITGSIKDNSVLYIDFYIDGQTGYFRRKIRLPNTSDKSEEEILEAIRYFCKFSKNYSSQTSSSEIIAE